MRITRMALRIVSALTIAMGAVWIALRSVESPAEDGFPYWLQSSVGHAFRFFIVCAAILAVVELTRIVVSRLQR